MIGYLVLENGNIFEGKRIGYEKDCICEVVFNTSMAGYLEIFSDPSYAGQGVVMTYPLIRKLWSDDRRFRIKENLGRCDFYS